jgi:TRAP-type mannitol/chloroaromatic compound transport system substrate-binding protein
MEKATNGRLILQPVEGGAIVPGAKALEGVHNRQVPACHTYDAYHIYLEPTMGLFSMVSGGMSAVQQILWFQSGEGEALASEAVQDLDLVNVGHGAWLPPEVWAHSTIMLKTVADLKGWKVRTAGEGGDILSRMGAAPVVLPGGEIYESLQRGVIDANEYGTVSGNWDMAFHEVADYMYLSPSRGPTGNHSWWVNKDDWATLPVDIQETWKHVIHEEGVLFYTEVLRDDYTGLARYEDYGTIVEPLPKAIEDTFMTTAEEYYNDKAAGDPFYAKVYQSQVDWRTLCEAFDVR